MSANSHRRSPERSPVDWLAWQIRTAWQREGEPPQTGFSLARPVVVLCGIVSLLALATATLTILSLHSLWQFHEGAGFVLLPVLAVKMVPIGGRAAAYCWRAVVERVRGRPHSAGITPPVLVARLSAPLLVADTALLLVSGIVMWHTGDQRSLWSTVHNASAVAGGILVAIHLACHARSTLAVARHSVAAPGERRTGGRVPPMVVAASLMAGIVLAVFTVPGASWNQGRGSDQHPGPDRSAGQPAGNASPPGQPVANLRESPAS